jgi:hypothetical protein
MKIHITVLRRTGPALIGLALVILPRSLYAQAGSVAQPASSGVSQEKLLEDIGSTNGLVRVDAAILLEHRQGQMIRKLLAILDSPIPDEQKMDAAVILGACRERRAVPFLVNHLDWNFNLHTNTLAYDAYIKSSGAYFTGGHDTRNVGEVDVRSVLTNPVLLSLNYIGIFAIPALLDKLSQSDNPSVSNDCVFTCIAIEGTAVTQFRLERLLQKETDSKKKERIQTALEMLKEFKIPEPF